MAGIRVNTPQGPNWQYSLDNQTWQTARIFPTQLDGSPFVVGETYQVICRNLVDKLITANTIVFGLKSSDDTIPVTLQTVIENGSETERLPYFAGGIAVDLETIPDTEAIHLVTVGADGTFYKLDTDAKLNALLVSMLKTVLPDSLAQTIWCEISSRCVLGAKSHRFRNFRHYEFVDLPVTLDPVNTIRYDVNNCDEFRGWNFDENHPNTSPPVRIVRDGLVVKTITPTISRPDVRDYLIKQGKLPVGSTFDVYGWSYPKTQADKDGVAHTFEAYAGSSTLKATTDGSVPATITCGAPVVTPTNPAPTITGTYADQQVTKAGNQLLDPTTGLFSDTDALTLSATLKNGQPLPAGIRFDASSSQPFTVLDSFANQTIEIRLKATDTANQSVVKDFKLTVNRPVVNPVYLTGQKFGGDIEVIEGGSARVKILNTLSDGSTNDYTGGGTYSIDLPYPDLMRIVTEAGAIGLITTAETVTDDVPVKLRFTFPDKRSIVGDFTVKNKISAGSPIVDYFIKAVRIPEGQQGVAQVYAKHADGTESEVLQANGSKFELLGQYPNGMLIGYGNTARALIQTAGNSVTADVDVTVRFTFAGGQIVDGIITVVNQENPTTENPNPNPAPAVDKFAAMIRSQTANAPGYYNLDFFYKTNLPVGTEMEDLWVEWWSLSGTGQTPEWTASFVTDATSVFPDGFKDYTVNMLYTSVPASVFQTHSVQHIKIRQKGTSTVLLETTFDPYGLSLRQPKQYFPL